MTSDSTVVPLCQPEEMEDPLTLTYPLIFYAVKSERYAKPAGPMTT
jgi:hypothetical protein